MFHYNKELIRRFVEEFQNQHNAEAMDQFCDPGFVNHSPGPGLPPTLEGSKQFHRMLFTALPDLHMTIQHQAAAGVKVWTHKTAAGTPRGALEGGATTGKPVSWKIIEIMTIRGGKVTEHWVAADIMGLMQQLAAGARNRTAAGAAGRECR